MAELAADAVAAAEQRAVGDDGAADAGAHREHDHVSTSRPAPKRNSAHPAAFASFSMMTGTSMRASSVALSGSLRQAMFGAWMTVARSRSMNPAAATPTAATS